MVSPSAGVVGMKAEAECGDSSIRCWVRQCRRRGIPARTSGFLRIIRVGLEVKRGSGG